MFQNNRINIICRVVCLLTFIIVILFAHSFITLSLITLFFYLFTRNDDIKLIHLITIILFLISYFTNNSFILKMILVIDMMCYFLIKPYEEKIMYNNINCLNKYSIRFFGVNNRKDIVDNNWFHTIYVTIHLLILFITIMVG